MAYDYQSSKASGVHVWKTQNPGLAGKFGVASDGRTCSLGVTGNAEV